MRRFRTTATAGSLLCAAIGAGPAIAQAPQLDDEQVQLPTITVTGEKIERDQLRTYSGVSVVTGSEIEALGLPDIRSTLRLLPNVNSSPSNNGNNGIVIRGINSEGLGSPGGNLRPLSSLVIDGATQSFEGVRRGARGLWDIDQVEVFRGPQSTLQGRNALAGAVVVRSRDPTNYWETAARAILGQYGQQEGAVMVSGPLIQDQLAFRVTGESIREEHDISYTDPRLDFLDDGRYRSVRAKLLATPLALPGLLVRFTMSDVYDRPAVTAVSGPNYFDRVLRQAAPGIETRENDVRSYVLEADYEVSGQIRLTSVSSWVDTDVNFETPTEDYIRDETRDDSDFTQDLRVAYMGRDTSAVVGLFLGRFRNARDSLVRARLVPNMPPVTVQNLESSSAIDNVGVYGEVRWRFHEQWTLIAGAREDREDFAETFHDRTSGRTTTTDTDYRAFLPKAGVSYDISEHQSAALTVSRGYRAGLVDRGVEVDPEYLLSYELAYRAQTPDRRYTFSANAFYYDWTDQQITMRDPANPLLTITTNAGASTAYGMELQVAAAPISGARIGATLGLLHTELDEFVTESGDFSGNEFPEAPKVSASVWATYRHPSGAFAAMDYSYKSAFYATSDLANQPSLRVPWSGIVNIRLGYEADNWSLVGFVENVMDTDYLVGRDILLGAYVGDKRRIGATLTVRYP